jgi:anti-anti-sigma factor
MVAVPSGFTKRQFTPKDGSDAAWFGLQSMGDYAVVTARGEIDILTAPALGEALVHAAYDSAGIVIDLCEVTLLDSTGIAVIIAASKGARATHGTMSLAGATGVVRRVLEHTRLDEVFAIYAGVREAVAAATSP